MCLRDFYLIISNYNSKINTLKQNTQEPISKFQSSNQIPFVNLQGFPKSIYLCTLILKIAK